MIPPLTQSSGNGRGHDAHRCRTLSDTARFLYLLGTTPRILEPYQVHRIERSALRKVQQELSRHDLRS